MVIGILILGQDPAGVLEKFRAGMQETGSALQVLAPAMVGKADDVGFITGT